ncbi:MAG: tRNA uridine-5-carboxymethylaminomethyl(34) synthesis GTPase MnmE [Pseudomonadota bacterium]
MLPSTIFALSSASGRAGIAVIRISGPATTHVLQALIGKVPAPRHAYLTAIKACDSDVTIDEGLVVFFPGPASFTGEDVAELHIHGSVAVVNRLLDELGSFDGLTMAEPGAFSERAFLNGKLDLTSVEGLADLLDAETDRQRALAIAQTSGVLRDRAAEWRTDLVRARALLEAVLDFSDEADVTEGPIAEAFAILGRLKSELETALVDSTRADTIRKGVRVALVGAPNAGKSSLLNALAARDVAIVTDVPGTTRDAIEIAIDIEGVPVTVIDTAGLRETNDAIEREGVRRARAAAEEADLVLHLEDRGAKTKARVGDFASVLTVWTKADRHASPAMDESLDDIVISTRTEAGLDALLAWLGHWVRDRIGEGEPPLVTRARQRMCITQAHCIVAACCAAGSADLELRAEDLRRASDALARLTGEIDAEDVLDDIFAGFCIGK